MYQIGEKVVYSNYGICSIISIICENFMDEPREYYVLKPAADCRSTIFVPCGGRLLPGIPIRPLLSPGQAALLLASPPRTEFPWIRRSQERRSMYQRILASADCQKLMILYRTLWQKQEELSRQRKKLSLTDEQFLCSAGRLLTQELSEVLCRTPADIFSLLSEYAVSAHSDSV